MNEWGGDSIAGQLLSTARPVMATQTAIRIKDAEREEILSAVELFKARGGKIEVIPYGVSKDNQLRRMRAGELEMVSMNDLAERWGVHWRSMPLILAKWPTLIYIMKEQVRWYWIEDIVRIEQTPDFKRVRPINPEH